ncbi:TPA: phospholipase D family protein [Burkholderia contaminans]|nr:phospholipase D family protein [Burkholderia contaminans]
MASSVVTTGIKGDTYKALLRKHIVRTKPSVVGLAVAYVSTSGIHIVKSILDEGGVKEVRLVADTKDGVTHPKALRIALDSGWGVRVVDSLLGTFHPKLYVGADRFNDTTGVDGLSLVIAGSHNLSLGAFARNAECAFYGTAPQNADSVARAWLDCWELGAPLTATKLIEYEKYFAVRNRHRKPEDLILLGVADGTPKATAAGAPPKSAIPPKAGDKAISETAASIAWVGLQSFTGEYNLQIEFPKEAGLVLLRIFGKSAKGGSINLLCADRVTRTFKYKFYGHNGMFRLNVPNEAPLVDWARAHKKGIAYVEHDDADLLSFRILQPGQPLMDVVDRSLALGTWGRTPTRLYGWY